MSMGVKIYIPKMGANINNAIIVKLYFKKGDKVKKGDILFEIETEKSIYDIEAEGSGTILALECREGDNFHVLDEIGFIGVENETVPELQVSSIKEKSEKSSLDIKSTPAAKKLATAHNLDIISVFKDYQKIIKESDILEYLDFLKKTNVTMQEIPARKKIEINNIASNKEYIVSSVTVSVSSIKIKNEVDKIKKEYFININLGEYLCFKAVQLLKKYPLLNCYYNSGKFMIYKDINVGLVINVDGQLLVPVIQDAEKLPIEKFIERYKQLVMKSIKHDLSADEIKDSTFTISDLSSYNVLNFNPLINFRQSAILGISSEYDSCKFANGQIIYDPKINLTVAFDHRVADGKYVADFLNEFANN